MTVAENVKVFEKDRTVPNGEMSTTPFPDGLKGCQSPMGSADRYVPFFLFVRLKITLFRMPWAVAVTV